MKRSSVCYVSGLLATVAVVGQIARSVFYVLEGYRHLAEKFGMSVEMLGYMNLAFITIIWGLLAASFFILINDRRNILSALLGGVSCVIFVMAMAVCIFANPPFWSGSVVGSLWMVCYFLAVVFLKTTVPSGVRITTIIALGIDVLVQIGLPVVAICLRFNGLGVYWKIAVWSNVLCWLVLAVHYVLMIITSKSAREDIGVALPASDAFCTTCGARVHFDINQNQVVCGNCGVPSFRVSAETNRLTVNRGNANCVSSCMDVSDFKGNVSICRAMHTETMELACPYCGGKCEAPTTIINGQHLECPYCSEKFAYHS